MIGIKKRSCKHTFYCPCCGKDVGKGYHYDLSAMYFYAINLIAKGAHLEPLVPVYGDKICMNLSKDGVYYESIDELEGQYKIKLKKIKNYLYGLREAIDKDLNTQNSDELSSLKNQTYILETKIKNKDVRSVNIWLEVKEYGITYRINGNTRYKLDRRCPSCKGKIAQSAGEYPQIVVSVVGSKKTDTKGFITSAIYKIRNYDKRFKIEYISETSTLKDVELNPVPYGGQEHNIEWNYDKTEKVYKDYYTSTNAEYPELESKDPYDRACFQSYTFKVKNGGNTVLLTIIDINEHFLYSYKHFIQNRTMRGELAILKNLLKCSGHVFFVLDPESSGNQDLIDGMNAFKSSMNDKALYAIVCYDRPVNINISRYKLEVNTMKSLLKTNRDTVNSKIDFKNNGPQLINNRKCLYFLCSPEEHFDANHEQPLNCELPFYWVLILEGAMGVFVQDGNSEVLASRGISAQRYWSRIEGKLYLRD